MALTAAEKRLASAVGFHEDVCELVKKHCGGRIRRLTTFTDTGEQSEADGIVASVSRDKLMPIIGEMQEAVLPRGYRAFWSDVCSADGSKEGDGVAVLKGTDEAAIVRLHQTSGGNYGVSTEDILKRVESWRGLCDLEILGAGPSWVAIWVKTLPKNVCAFAEEIYEFCPDTVDQGVGLQSEKNHPEKFAAARRLCPKLSAKMERKLKEQKERFAAMPVPPELRAMIESSGFTTPTDMGIRLLAYKLQESGELFLWWD